MYTANLHELNTLNVTELEHILFHRLLDPGAQTGFLEGFVGVILGRLVVLDHDLHVSVQAERRVGIMRLHGRQASIPGFAEQAEHVVFAESRCRVRLRLALHRHHNLQAVVAADPVGGEVGCFARLPTLGARDAAQQRPVEAVARRQRVQGRHARKHRARHVITVVQRTQDDAVQVDGTRVVAQQSSCTKTQRTMKH